MKLSIHAMKIKVFHRNVAIFLLFAFALAWAFQEGHYEGRTECITQQVEVQK